MHQKAIYSLPRTKRAVFTPLQWPPPFVATIQLWIHEINLLAISLNSYAKKFALVIILKSNCKKRLQTTSSLGTNQLK